MKKKTYKKEKLINIDRYPKPDWAVQQIVRANGLIEDICSHGVGHPNKEFVLEHDREGIIGLGIHGCDGCCSKLIRDMREGKI